MKKKVVLSLVVVLAIIGVVYAKNTINSKKMALLSDENYTIEQILKTKAYSYLPEEAKDYIREVYAKTGEILLTEKNKEENRTYLNPQYVEYLVGSKNTNYEVIPSEVILDYVYSETSNSEELPSHYDLRNVNGKNFITPIKDQGDLGLCWAFAAIEQVESYLLIQNNTSYEDGISQLFSTRQLDFATATDSIIDRPTLYDNDRFIGDGGMFNYFTHIGIDNLTLVDESWIDYNTVLTQLEYNKVYNFSKSLYEVNSAIYVPHANLSEESEDYKNSYLNQVKKIIMQYGGASIGAVDPIMNCSTDLNGNTFIYNDGNCQAPAHAMHLIGWDDNFEYSVCTEITDSEGYYYIDNNIDTCAGKVVSGTGAWIIRNSWGEIIPYLYLAYDSMNVEINATTNLSEKNWDNYYVGYQTLEYDQSLRKSYVTLNRNSETTERLKKIKIETLSQNSNYNFYLVSDGISEFIGSISVTLPGIYTLDLSQENILLKEVNFEISAVSDDGSTLNIINVYTDNVDTYPQIRTFDTIFKNSLSSSEDYTIRAESDVVGILDNEIIDYKILDSNSNEISYDYSYSENIVSANRIFGKITIDGQLPKGKYILQTIYKGDVLSQSNIDINEQVISTLGSGTEADPYLISTPAQLNLIRTNSIAYYKLTNDIDLTHDTQDENGLFYNEGKGWEPVFIGNFEALENDYTYARNGFSGGFDGDGHTITGLFINRPDEDFVGLFSGIYNMNYSNVHVKNLTLKDSNITGRNYVGSIVGYATETTYERCLTLENLSSIGGKIEGNNYVGGIVGGLEGGSNLTGYCNLAYVDDDKSRFNVNNLYNDASINSTDYSGGLIGYLKTYNYYGKESSLFLSNIQNIGMVNSNNNASSLIGKINPLEENTITIENALGLGTLNGTNNYGIFSGIGSNHNGNIVLRNVYYLTNDAYPANNITSQNLISQKEFLQLKNSQIYTNWDDFNSNWKIETKNGISRIPILKFISSKFRYTNLTVGSINIKNNKIVNIYDLILPDTQLAKNITYEIDDPSVVTIDNEGNITGLKSGVTSIHITSFYDGYDNDIEINVNNKLKVNFYANDETENLIVDEVENSITTSLRPNTYIREGYIFINWNTKSDGTGVTYTDEQSISLSNDLTLYAQWEKINEEINNYIVDDNIIRGVSLSTKLSNYLKNFDYSDIYDIKVYKAKTLLTNNDLVGTGSIVKIYENDEFKEEYTNIILGDVTGNGKVGIGDVTKLYQYFKGKITMDDCYKEAGDVVDKGVIKINDVAKLYQYFKGKISSLD